MIKKLVLFLIAMIGGCDMQDENNELANKPDYSVLQHYDYVYSKANHDKPYMIFTRALNTDTTVVAFPIKNKPVGYVFIIAKSKYSPFVKYMPEVDFDVTQDAYLAVKDQTSLSGEVEQFILMHKRK
jgi:hypothetical protein